MNLLPLSPQVEALRLNDFMAIIVDANLDYHNNGGNSTEATDLDISTLLHVGGLAESIGEAPFHTEDVGVCTRQ